MSDLNNDSNLSRSLFIQPKYSRFLLLRFNDTAVIICLVLFSFYVGLTRFAYLQGEDYGVFLSVFGFVAKGVPLYSGILEIKDPLFLLTGAVLVKLFGPEGPFLLDILLFMVAGAMAYKTAVALNFDRFTSATGSVIILLTLSGIYYGSMRSTLFAIVLVIIAYFAAARGHAVLTGLVIAGVGGFKMPYLMVCLPVVLLLYEQDRTIKAIYRVILGFLLGCSAIFILLVVRGEFVSYLMMVSENFVYKSVYMKVLGRTEGMEGHIQTIASTGTSIGIFGLVLIVAVSLGILIPSRVSRLSILTLGSISALVLLLLSISAMWPHHFQVLAIYIWPLGLLLVSSMQTCLTNQVWLSNLSLFSHKLLVGIVLLLALSVLLIGLKGSGTYFTFKPKMPLNQVFNHKWSVPPEIVALEMAFSKHGGEKTFSRLGANDDSGFGAFLSEKWHLSCPRIGQYGHEPENIVNATLHCFETIPRYVIASPVFFSLQRSAGSFEQFRMKMLIILKDKFHCTSVVDWDNAIICVRRQA
jgi:hypothetical protein